MGCKLRILSKQKEIEARGSVGLCECQPWILLNFLQNSTTADCVLAWAWFISTMSPGRLISLISRHHVLCVRTVHTPSYWKSITGAPTNYNKRPSRWGERSHRCDNHYRKRVIGQSVELRNKFLKWLWQAGQGTRAMETEWGRRC